MVEVGWFGGAGRWLVVGRGVLPEATRGARGVQRSKARAGEGRRVAGIARLAMVARGWNDTDEERVRLRAGSGESGGWRAKAGGRAQARRGRRAASASPRRRRPRLEPANGRRARPCSRFASPRSHVDVRAPAGPQGYALRLLAPNLPPAASRPAADEAVRSGRSAQRANRSPARSPACTPKRPATALQ